MLGIVTAASELFRAKYRSRRKPLPLGICFFKVSKSETFIEMDST